MKKEKDTTADVVTISDKEKFTSVSVTRSFSHKQQPASPGYVWYKYSYIIGVKRNGKRVEGAVQINSSYESSVGEEAVQEYIKRKYIYKTDK